MKLHFPNPSRSFDENKNRVLFWGYDSAIEISFYVEADALKRLCPEMGDVEKSYLLAFDDSREKIYEIADKLYTHGRKGNYAYILAAKDF
ncbi:MAG: DUF1488 domain-containing protein [Gammaproteobacteria bacterium]|nr:DUF1488 domain-containing protein [Gammaproteobacteria bacterium]